MMTDEGANRLCAGVIKQAVNDYDRAIQCYRRYPNSVYAKEIIDSCEYFFREDMAFYSELDGEQIIRIIKSKYDSRGET